MRKLLISKRFVKGNNSLKAIQKDNLKKNKSIKSKVIKAKIGKVIENNDSRFIDCSADYEEMKKDFSLDSLMPEEIIERIAKREIIGLSGGGFPTDKKIQAVLDAKTSVKYLIVNAVECDPGLLHDKYLLSKFSDEIDKGINILKKCIDFNKVIIASKDNVPNKYPMGAEKLLIKYLLGIDIDSDMVPADKGILVLNVQTVYAIYEEFYKNKMERTKYVTVANLNTGMGEVVKVRLGQPLEEILPKTDIGYKESLPIYYGMGVMDAAECKDDEVINGKGNFIGFGNSAYFDNTEKCRKCGLCLRKCPMGVNVKKIIAAIDNETGEDLSLYNIDKCIKCGTCSYYCKAGKNTMEIINNYRIKLEDKKKKEEMKKTKNN